MCIRSVRLIYVLLRGIKDECIKVGKLRLILRLIYITQREKFTIV